MNADADPIALFHTLFEDAKRLEPHDATAMTLATADARGRPSARMVLLKGADERGFVFFSNRESRKGRELAENPFAALCLHWPASERQIRVEGRVEQISDEESDAYFATRPRDSQFSAWISQQSAPLSSRQELVGRLGALEERYPAEVPRPPFWGGYRVVPEAIEIWAAGAARLHDRFRYTRTPSGWKGERLNP
jgi:pyridoxamine 5'-phosphate oxidase